MERIVLGPYANYGLSTFTVHENIVFMGHFGGSFNLNKKKLETIEEQTTQTLENLEKHLKEIGLNRDNIAKLNVFLKNINDFQGMHHSWKNFFNKNKYPVRTVLTTEFIDDHCLIQVEGIAISDKKFEEK